MDKSVLQSALAEYFAPWVQALGLRVEGFDADSVTLRLPQNDELSRVGGMLCGQAMMRRPIRPWCWPSSTSPASSGHAPPSR